MVTRIRLIISVACLLIAASSAAWPSVFYVNPSAAGLNNGSSWEDGFTSLQAAVDIVGASEGGDFWVKSGVYTDEGPAGPTDSFEALDPDAVDIVGEERNAQFVSSEAVPSQCHLTVIYLHGDPTKAIPPAPFGFTTDQDSFADRLSGMMGGGDEVMVFANHPSFITGAGDARISSQDLTSAANASALNAMELKNDTDVAKWDYVLAHLDDQAGDCSKILWGIRADDQHHISEVDYKAYNGAVMGCIPTQSQVPVYASRRLAFKDMVHRGSFVSLPANSKCGMPSYTFQSSGGSATRLRVSVHLYNIGGATSASIKFYGCDYATGNTPGALLFTAPLTLNTDNTASYYLTTNGKWDGQPLTVQQKANIKYIRPVITWRVGFSNRDAYLQPVRIRSNGNWWNGPAYTLAGAQGVIGPSPYPVGGTDTGETIYFNTHAHTTASDGDARAPEMRAKYWENFGGLDPTKPRFTVITDHQTRTPFDIPVASVVEMKPGVRLYGGFAGTETTRDQRNWTANPTILDGLCSARCVSADGTSWVAGSQITVDGFVLRNGKVLSSYGGGMYAFACVPTIRNCRFETNAARAGGGLCVSSGAVADIADCTFTGNSSWGLDGGGGMSCLGSYAWLTDCTFTGNTAISGGGIYADGSSVTADDCAITGNIAEASGGGLYSSNSAATVNACTIKDNRAANGAGAYTAEGRQMLTNCIFAGNYTSGTSGQGGGIFSAADSVDGLIAGNTIVGNTAYQGGGIYQNECSSYIANNVIAFNAGGIYVHGNQPTLMNNDVYGNTINYSGVAPGSGDISADPLFVNQASGDYHLTVGSPCIDAGTASLPNLPEQDMDGQSRTWGLGPDIGADEFWPLALSPRNSADGAPIGWSKAVVTAAFTGFFYVESDDRAWGVRVDKANHSLAPGMRTDIIGTVETNVDGERYIEADTALQNGTGTIAPVVLPNRNIGGGDWRYDPVTGVGQKGIAGAPDVNNIGLLVCTTGRVTYACPSYFYVNDGSALRDGSGFLGIKVLPYGLTVPAQGSYVRLTGISSCYKSGSDLKRLIRAIEIAL